MPFIFNRNFVAMRKCWTRSGTAVCNWMQKRNIDIMIMANTGKEMGGGGSVHGITYIENSSSVAKLFKKTWSRLSMALAFAYVCERKIVSHARTHQTQTFWLGGKCSKWNYLHPNQKLLTNVWIPSMVHTQRSVQHGLFCYEFLFACPALRRWAMFLKEQTDSF